MQDPFDQKKLSILQEIGATNNGIPDLSPKGSIDEFCIPIINLINKDQDMVTTSSCSGRVSVFLEGIKSINENDIKIGSKGNYGRWLFVTHDPKELPEWYKSQNFHYNTELISSNVNVNTRYILFKFEPLILHVKCRNSHTANALYTTAMNCGFRESGIGSNNVVAIRISIKLDIPIGYENDGGDLMLFVSENYLELSTKLSHDRFKENFKKLELLYEHIETKFPTLKVEKKVETKQEKRERMIKEGLSRREEVRNLKDQKKKEQQDKKKKE